MLVVLELATANVLLVGASLLARSFVKLVTIDLGYDATHVLTFQVAARGDRYSPDQLQRFADDLANRLLIGHAVCRRKSIYKDLRAARARGWASQRIQLSREFVRIIR